MEFAVQMEIAVAVGSGKVGIDRSFRGHSGSTRGNGEAITGGVHTGKGVSTGNVGILAVQIHSTVLCQHNILICIQLKEAALVTSCHRRGTVGVPGHIAGAVLHRYSAYKQAAVLGAEDGTVVIALQRNSRVEGIANRGGNCLAVHTIAQKRGGNAHGKAAGHTGTNLQLALIGGLVQAQIQTGSPGIAALDLRPIQIQHTGDVNIAAVALCVTAGNEGDVTLIICLDPGVVVAGSGVIACCCTDIATVGAGSAKGDLAAPDVIIADAGIEVAADGAAAAGQECIVQCQMGGGGGNMDIAASSGGFAVENDAVCEGDLAAGTAVQVAAAAGGAALHVAVVQGNGVVLDDHITAALGSRYSTAGDAGVGEADFTPVAGGAIQTDIAAAGIGVRRYGCTPVELTAGDGNIFTCP